MSGCFAIMPMLSKYLLELGQVATITNTRFLLLRATKFRNQEDLRMGSRTWIYKSDYSWSRTPAWRKQKISVLSTLGASASWTNTALSYLKRKAAG